MSLIPALASMSGRIFNSKLTSCCPGAVPNKFATDMSKLLVLYAARHNWSYNFIHNFIQYKLHPATHTFLPCSHDSSPTQSNKLAVAVPRLCVYNNVELGHQTRKVIIGALEIVIAMRRGGEKRFGSENIPNPSHEAEDYY
jgi:hypothetical protein